MLKTAYMLLLSMLLSNNTWAQTNSITDEASPKLKRFFLAHPDAATVFSNAISSTFSNRTVQLSYFYTSDDTKPRAYHFYPSTAGMPEVMVCIRENQTPLDEFIGTYYEIINSRSENAFGDIFQKAWLGTITREQFAREILQNEFEATKSVLKTLLDLKLNANEVSESYFYKKFAECPTNNFDDFLSYSKKVSQSRNAVQEYEAKYDLLRKMYLDSNTATNLTVPK